MRPGHASSVPIDAQTRTGRSSIRFARDGFKFWLILLPCRHHLQSSPDFRADQPPAASWRRRYALWTIATQLSVTNTSVLLTVTGVLVCLIGLVSDQIATLRLGLGDDD